MANAKLFDGTPCADTLPRCPDCGAGYERFNSLAYHRANECKGAPMTETKRTNTPEPDRDSGRTSARAEFLKPVHVSRDWTTLTIGKSILTFKSQYGLQIVVGVAVGGKDYDWGLKVNGGVHITVETLLGRNLITWPGKALRVRRDEWEDPRDGGKVKDRIAIEGERSRD